MRPTRPSRPRGRSQTGDVPASVTWRDRRACPDTGGERATGRRHGSDGISVSGRRPAVPPVDLRSREGTYEYLAEETYQAEVGGGRDRGHDARLRARHPGGERRQRERV